MQGICQYGWPASLYRNFESSLPCSVYNLGHSWAKDFKDPDLVRVARLSRAPETSCFFCFLASVLLETGPRMHETSRMRIAPQMQPSTAFVKRHQTVKTSQYPGYPGSFSLSLFPAFRLPQLTPGS